MLKYGIVLWKQFGAFFWKLQNVDLRLYSTNIFIYFTRFIRCDRH